MKRVKELFLTRNLTVLLNVLAMILVIGIVGAGLTTNDTRWLGWSLSRLGENQTISAAIFNVSVILASFVLARIGVILSENLHAIDDHRAAKLTKFSVLALAICALGVGLFPNDTWHQVHFLLSRNIVALLSIYMVALPLVLTGLNRRQYIAAYCAPILILYLSIRGYVAKNISFVLFEILLGFVIFAWFFAVCRLVEQKASADEPIAQSNQ